MTRMMTSYATVSKSEICTLLQWTMNLISLISFCLIHFKILSSRDNMTPMNSKGLLLYLIVSYPIKINNI